MLLLNVANANFASKNACPRVGRVWYGLINTSVKKRMASLHRWLISRFESNFERTLRLSLVVATSMEESEQLFGMALPANVLDQVASSLEELHEQRAVDEKGKKKNRKKNRKKR